MRFNSRMGRGEGQRGLNIFNIIELSMIFLHACSSCAVFNFVTNYEKESVDERKTFIVYRNLINDYAQHIWFLINISDGNVVFCLT